MKGELICTPSRPGLEARLLRMLVQTNYVIVNLWDCPSPTGTGSPPGKSPSDHSQQKGVPVPVLALQSSQMCSDTVQVDKYTTEDGAYYSQFRSRKLARDDCQRTADLPHKSFDSRDPNFCK